MLLYKTPILLLVVALQSLHAYSFKIDVTFQTKDTTIESKASQAVAKAQGQVDTLVKQHSGLAKLLPPTVIVDLIVCQGATPKPYKPKPGVDLTIPIPIAEIDQIMKYLSTYAGTSGKRAGQWREFSRLTSTNTNTNTNTNTEGRSQRRGLVSPIAGRGVSSGSLLARSHINTPSVDA